MRRIPTLAATALLGMTVASGADLVVDFSLDTLGQSTNTYIGNTLAPPLSQNMADSFVLTSPTMITGGAFFGVTGGGFNGFGVGSPVEVAFFADSVFGSPDEMIVHQTGLTVDAYDREGVHSVAGASRYHATLATPIILAPGTYYFTMPGTAGDPTCARTAAYDDGISWWGEDSNIDLDRGGWAGGDLPFQLEGIRCFGDLDGDSQVGLSDLTVLLSNFGIVGGMTYDGGDSDGDGDVDLTDLTTFLSLYGTICS